MQRVRQIIDNQPDTRKIITNVLWLVADNLLRLGAAVVVSAWVARYLGVDDYGRLRSVITLLLMFQVVLRLGFDEVLVREFIKQPDNRPALLSSAFVMRIVISGLLIPIMPYVMRLIQPDDPILPELMVIGSLSVIFLSFEVIDYWFQAIVQSKYAVWARNGALFGASMVRLMLIWQNAPLLAFVYVIVLEYLLLALGLSAIYIRTQPRPLLGSIQFTIMRQLLRDGSPMIITGLAVTAFMRIDQLMLVRLLPPDVYSYEVGLYAAAASLSEIWFFVPISILNSLFPSIQAAYERNTTDYQRIAQRIMRLLALLSLIYTAGVVVLSPIIIGVLFGAAYAQSATLLSVLVCSSVFISMNNMWARVLTIENQLRYTALLTVTSAVMNIVLNLWLIPQMGALGSAIATVITYAFVGYGGSFIVPASIPLGRMQTWALLLPNPLMRETY